MVFSLHKFKHYLLGNKFVFLCRSYGLNLLGKQSINLKENNYLWLLLFLKYDFTITYKLNKIHIVGDVCLNCLIPQNPQES